MNISGLQKLTLLDYPGYIACTIFTPGCNFRCPFCHNSGLVTRIDAKEEIPESEILAFLSKRKGVLDGVCITGGEPLLQPDLKSFIKKVKEMGFKVKLDSNGYSPDKLQELIDEGLLDMVAMDIKNSPEKYALTTGLPSIDMSLIAKSIQIITSSQIRYEFRTTAVQEFHKKEDFAEIAHLIKGAKAYFIQNFVDSGAVIQSGLHGFDRASLEEFRQAAMNNGLTNVEIRGVD
jgi:pyruvate formate lyase activating enzyme